MKKSLSLLILSICGIHALLGQTNAPNGSTRPTATPVTVPAAYDSGIAVNYIRSRQAVAPISNKDTFAAASYQRVRQTTQYIDGLGRPLQTVAKQSSPALKDVVSPSLYDSFGREQYKYLPYTSTESNGNFKLDPFGAQSTFMNAQFSGESIFYNETKFERSPLNRPTKTLSPGNSWGGSDRGVGTEYLINTAGDSVHIWNIANDTLFYTSADTGRNIPSGSSMYGAGLLFEMHTIDEHNNRVVEYKDKEGKVILRKVQIDSSPFAGHTGWLCTYFVYDDFGLLRFVIPPNATQYLATHSWALSTGVINELCYRYEYDGRNRKIAQKAPGAGWVYMVYDRRDRPTYSQDANLRDSSKWLITLYDGQNRTISTGMISYSGNRSALQRLLDNRFDTASRTTEVAVNFSAPDTLYVNERVVGKPIYRAKDKIVFTGEFTTESGAETETALGAATVSTTSLLLNYDPFPSGANFIALTVNYYDDYAFTSKTYSTTNNSNIDSGGNAYPDSLPTITSTMTRGLLTGTKVRAIEDPSNLAAGGWLETVQFYDHKSRIVQMQSDNYKNGTDIATTRYDFTGNPITIYQVHNNAAAGQTVKIKINRRYDQEGRLLDVKETIDDDATTTRYLARNEYNERGQLLSKKLGQLGQGNTTEMELQAYEYNIRGSLKGINKGYSDNSGSTAWFGTELNYDYGFAVNKYNGDIAGAQWRSRGDGERRAVGYGYDATSRILFSDFNQYTGGTWNKNAGIDFSMLMGDGTDHAKAYDANGNIKTMQQKAWKIGASDLIDSLTYTYTANSNKLLNVIDARNDTLTTLGDFRSSGAYIASLGTKTTAATDYAYDVNGNLVKDRNKDIGTSSTNGVVYNHLNLPYEIAVAGKGTITFIYDATGNKLEKRTVATSPSKTTKTTYLGGYVYENDTLQYFEHEEGRVRKKRDNSYVYDYFVKDHLSNTRAVLSEEYQQDTYPVATLENGATVIDTAYYSINLGNIVDTSAATGFSSATGHSYQNNNGNPPYNTNPYSVVTAVSTKLYKLNGNTGDKVGLGITLKVMTGDTVSIYGKSYWHSNGSAPTNSYSIPVNDLLTLLSGTGLVANAGKGATSGALTTPGIIPTGLSHWIADSVPTVSGKPKAYINWILFDDQFRIVSSNSGFSAVSNTSDEINPHTAAVTISRNGYLYVYCSNESNTNVFFDNVQVIHNRGPLIEETHYYPYGVIMAGISSKAAGKLENMKKKFQGQEYNADLGLDVYEFKYRMNDAQTGRFWQVDPLSDKYVHNSTYAFSENKVTGHIELEGLEAIPGTYPDVGNTRAVANLFLPKEKQTPMAQINADSKVEYEIKGRATPLVLATLMEPQIAIPFMVGYMTGLPVMPSPQAFATAEGGAALNNIKGSLTEAAPEARVTAANVLPDEATVVRGGLNTPAAFEKGIKTHPSGVVGASVECGTCGVKELSKSIPHNQIGVTTVGAVRSAGGDVIKTSGGSPFHATLTGLPPKKASELFTPVIPNPNK